MFVLFHKGSKLLLRGRSCGTNGTLWWEWGALAQIIIIITFFTLPLIFLVLFCFSENVSEFIDKVYGNDYDEKKGGIIQLQVNLLCFFFNGQLWPHVFYKIKIIICLKLRSFLIV